jgi:hypothetical protein
VFQFLREVRKEEWISDEALLEPPAGPPVLMWDR